MSAEPGAFDYDQDLQTATVQPPAPFSGLATYRRGAPLANRWLGTLAADFPGRSDVDLIGVVPEVSVTRTAGSLVGYQSFP